MGSMGGIFNDRPSTDQCLGQAHGQLYSITQVLGRDGLPRSQSIWEIMKDQGFFGCKFYLQYFLIILNMIDAQY